MLAGSKGSPDLRLKTAHRKRRGIQIGIAAAAIAVLAVSLVLYLAMPGDESSTLNAGKAVRVASSKLITKPGSNEPTVVLSIYEDFLCPHCRAFEYEFGPTINDLINAGAIAADYYMVAVLDGPQNQNYSSRAGSAAYCVADESTDTFQRFHSALYAQQPSETATTYPPDAQLAETARQAGAKDTAFDCINSGRYAGLVQGLAQATSISATPTLRINGEDYQLSTPGALVAKIDAIVGK
jgi:protein-disulfide isomerase